MSTKVGLGLALSHQCCVGSASDDHRGVPSSHASFDAAAACDSRVHTARGIAHGHSNGVANNVLETLLRRLGHGWPKRRVADGHGGSVPHSVLRMGASLGPMALESWISVANPSSAASAPRGLGPQAAGTGWLDPGAPRHRLVFAPSSSGQILALCTFLRQAMDMTAHVSSDWAIRTGRAGPLRWCRTWPTIMSCLLVW